MINELLQKNESFSAKLITRDKIENQTALVYCGICVVDLSHCYIALDVLILITGWF